MQISSEIDSSAKKPAIKLNELVRDELKTDQACLPDLLLACRRK